MCPSGSPGRKAAREPVGRARARGRRRAAPALALIALLGCGGGSSDGSSPPGATPAPTATPGSEPRAGERFTVGETVYVSTLLGYGEVRPRESYPAYIRSKAAGGDILWGADLGLPVTLRGAGAGGADLTLYLFGDTDQLDLDVLAEKKVVQKHAPRADEEFVGPSGPFEGDAIGLSTDADPSDGVRLAHVYRNLEPGDARPVCDLVAPDGTPIVSPEGFRPVFLDGVHPSACVQTHPNTTPTGAWLVGDTVFMLAGVQDVDHPEDAQSFLAASGGRATDGAPGLRWKVLNGGQPFSQRGFSARFIHGFGLEVDARDYQDDTRSGPCELPLPAGADTRGILLFGAGLWKGSDVYLAFLPSADLLAAAAEASRHVSPWYFAGTEYSGPDGTRCWSASEADAAPVIRASDTSAYSRFEDACGSTVTGGGVGYTSVIHVDQTLADGTRIDRLVMLLSPAYRGETAEGGELDADLGTVLVTGDPLRPWVWNLAVDGASHDGRLPSDRRFRPVPVPDDPSHGLEPNRPACSSAGAAWETVAGYAPLLIDRYTRLSADGMGVDLYFNISRSKVPKGPDDTGPDTVDAYHYVVETMRTTLRPSGP